MKPKILSSQYYFLTHFSLQYTKMLDLCQWQSFWSVSFVALYRRIECIRSENKSLNYSRYHEWSINLFPKLEFPIEDCHVANFSRKIYKFLSSNRKFSSCFSSPFLQLRQNFCFENNRPFLTDDFPFQWNMENRFY